MARAGNLECSPNSILRLRVPDLRSAEPVIGPRFARNRWLRLSGTTIEAGYDSRISKSRRPSLFNSFFTALEATTSPSLA